jgi:hypothetical protein
MGSPLRLISTFANSSSHIRRFVTEATGLGICTAVASQLWGWTGPILNFDNLPQTHYLVAGPGPRPDLAYGSPGGRAVAGEARGRSFMTSDRMTTEEYLRIVALKRWASRVGAQPGVAIPKWFMTWSYLSVSDTKVHCYDPGEPFFVSRDEVRAYIGSMEQALWASETTDFARFRDVPLRGGWRDASPLTEPNGHTWLFVGVLAHPIEDFVSTDFLDFLARQHSPLSSYLEWDLSGRLVAVLAHGGETHPDGGALSDLLEATLKQAQIAVQHETGNG